LTYNFFLKIRQPVGFVKDKKEGSKKGGKDVFKRDKEQEAKDDP
jgi:hypothetical protein